MKKEYIKILKEQIDKCNSLPVGKHNDIPDSEFSTTELEKGISVEREHSDNLEICKAIAKDHLSEFCDYYTRLKKMEEEAKREKGIKDND